MTRRILFLHTEAPTRRALIRERPAGHLILATNWIEPRDVEFYDEVVLLPHPAAVAETLARLDMLEFDELVVQTEFGLLAGSLLAERRGMQAPTPRAALWTTNKWLCRNALRDAGLRVPRFALAESADDVRRFAGGRWPVVLKPIASTLGYLVTRVDAEREVDDAVMELRHALPHSMHVQRCAAFAKLAGFDMECDATRQFLVEEYVEGTPRECDGLVFAGVPEIFGVTEQVVSRPPFFFIEAYLFPMPDAALEEASRRAIRVLGLEHGGFSIEFRGETVIEVNGRLGEDHGFSELFRAELGQAPIARWLERGATPRRSRGGGHALAYANGYEDALVRAVPSAADPGVEILVAPGTRMHAPPHPDMTPHLAYALVSHPDGAHAAHAAAKALVDALRFELEPLDAKRPSSTLEVPPGAHY